MTAKLASAGNPYPPIEAVADHGARPFWSIMIPVYNCAEYLRVTLASVLAQLSAEDDSQIEVIDDCSTRDDPAAVVAECGDRRVTYTSASPPTSAHKPRSRRVYGAPAENGSTYCTATISSRPGFIEPCKRRQGRPRGSERPSAVR